MTARELAQEMTNDEAAKIIGHTYISGMRAGKTQLEAALYKAIEALQERKTGKWIHGREISREYIGNEIISIQYEDWRCSACGMKVADIASSVSFKYCRDCGAKMEVDE